MSPQRALPLLPLALLLGLVACADAPPPGFDPNNPNSASSNNGANNSLGNNGGSDDNNGGGGGGKQPDPTNNDGQGNNGGQSDNQGNNDQNNDQSNNGQNNGQGNNGQGNNGGPAPEGCHPSNPETCDDDLDNDCDGLVDEGCGCTVAEKECYSGHPATLGVASCRAGRQVCDGEFYGACEGEVVPGLEACDGLDNDCNGLTDELPECERNGPQVTCPPDFDSAPLETISLTATASDPDGDPLSYRWERADGPIGSGTRAQPADQLQTSAFLDLAGVYEFRFTATDNTGESATCATRVNAIPSEDFRIELVWNVGVADDPSDVDLHLLYSPQDGWGSDRDCYFGNCNSSRGANLEWGAGGAQDNPRLDLDDVEGNGPENINIDSPENRTYRVGVHYWADDGFGPSVALVRIYCGGQLRKEFEPVTLRAYGFNDPANDFWDVADVVWSGGACTVRELGTPGNRQIHQTGFNDF